MDEFTRKEKQTIYSLLLDEIARNIGMYNITESSYYKERAEYIRSIANKLGLV